jgi:hypothetical protein
MTGWGGQVTVMTERRRMATAHGGLDRVGVVAHPRRMSPQLMMLAAGAVTWLALGTASSHQVVFAQIAALVGLFAQWFVLLQRRPAREGDGSNQ